MSSEQRRVVIIGGGFGGVFTALDLANSCSVTLVSLEDHFLFTPMLYEYVSGEVEAWHIAPRYKELLNDSVRFIRGQITEVNFDTREVAIEGRDRRLIYDALVLACGSVTNYWGVEGAEEHALPFRTLAHADDLRAHDSCARPRAAGRRAAGCARYGDVRHCRRRGERRGTHHQDV